MIRVERGTPTAEEVAALVGVLLLRRRAAGPPRPARVSRWWASGLAGGRGLRSGARPGPGAWRASGLPG
ncbi:MAG TPA: acyl-CoA carboxylase subunit epsilon [Micromonosporaceae bacterium]|nr:acyl-CoA carboxylase subunit epsilon [Micromonosporaceae bacterium]